MTSTSRSWSSKTTPATRVLSQQRSDCVLLDPNHARCAAASRMGDLSGKLMGAEAMAVATV